MRGADAFERPAMHEKFIPPIEVWIHGGKKRKDDEGEILEKIQGLFSEPDDAKVFLPALVVSVLGSQQSAASVRAEKSAKRP